MVTAGKSGVYHLLQTCSADTDVRIDLHTSESVVPNVLKVLYMSSFLLFCCPGLAKRQFLVSSYQRSTKKNQKPGKPEAVDCTAV